MARSVSVGLHVQTGGERQLAPTVSALQRRTDLHIVELHILLDGAMAGGNIEPGLAGLTYHSTSATIGAAKWFDILTKTSETDLIVFIECGSIVGPNWLPYLRHALDAGPRNGLAGPSTNLCWNQQSAFPNCGDSQQEIDATAAEAESRFRGGFAILEPPFGLAPFCYAVRGCVVKEIGDASPQSESELSWEMAYNLRAARAGFQSVWACSA